MGGVLALYGALNAGFIALARSMEQSRDCYPWRNEDFLRYLLPTLFEGRGADRVMIVGPSEAREDLLDPLLEEAFAGLHVFQGALSLGTFDDLLLTLEYLEGAYGGRAMPRVIVLGLTPRFVGNIPRDESPLVMTIDRYSPSHRVESGVNGSRLVDKTILEGLWGRARFLLKQPKRFKTALCEAALHFLPAEIEGVSRSVDPLDPDWAWMGHDFQPRGFGDWLVRMIRIYRSPYKYHHLRPMRSEGVTRWMSDPESFWFKVHGWDPDKDAAMIRGQFARLFHLTVRLNIRLFVVNLPEHPINRAGYAPGRYERYLELVRESIGTAPFLDLRELLGADEFYDVGHATLAGAIRVTRRTIDFLRAHAALR